MVKHVYSMKMCLCKHFLLKLYLSTLLVCEYLVGIICFLLYSWTGGRHPVDLGLTM